MTTTTQHEANLGGHRVAYRIIHSKAARRIRLRVGIHGLEVVQPIGRNRTDVSEFLQRNQAWILGQLQRVEQWRERCAVEELPPDELLFRGRRTKLRVERSESLRRGNLVEIVNGEIRVRRGPASTTPASRSLENWLRRTARAELNIQIETFAVRLGEKPARVYVRDQRTKWGSCSSRRNLSFNWRLILAPDFVLNYIVAHEVAHLAVPDHSTRFWLMVKGIFPDTQEAKAWLAANSAQLYQLPAIS